MTETRSLNEIKIESLSTLFPRQDVENLDKLYTFFEELSKQKNLGISLMIVGGSLTKPFPRKDIDILAFFEKDKDFPEIDFDSRHFEYSKAVFQRFRNLVDEIRKQNDVEMEYRQPALDEEFAGSDILKHDGSIIVKFKRGTPIELVPRMESKNVVERPVNARPFAVLLKHHGK